MSWATPAKGHMPFPGHRTCAEWDRPVSAKHEPPRIQDPPPQGDTEADRLARCANVPLRLAQLVVIACNREGVTLRQIRDAGRGERTKIARRSVTKQVSGIGYNIHQIGRALNRSASTVERLLKEAGR